MSRTKLDWAGLASSVGYRFNKKFVGDDNANDDIPTYKKSVKIVCSCFLTKKTML